MSDSSLLQDIEIKIRPLQLPHDGEELANLMNAFNKSWDVGFAGSGQNTAASAIELASQAKKIEIYVAETTSNQLVGYCSLHPHYEDDDACYVGILGAHPDFMGRKVGKNLMLKALNRAVEEKFTRLDLGTWAGNLKALPLYKKLGLFWVPETAVSMEDYMPYILSEPLFSSFWQKHPDWYSIFNRKIEQTPDIEKHNGLEVYTYHFVKEDEYLLVYIDRYAKQITGFDLNHNGSRLKLELSSTNKSYRGLSHTIELQVDSSESLTNISVIEHPSNGIIPLDKKEVQKESDMDPSSKTLRRVYHYNIGHETPLQKGQRKSSCVDFEIGWDTPDKQTHKIRLGVGLKIQTAVEVKLNPASEAIRINYSPKNIYLDLKNNLQKPVYGNLEITGTENIKTDILRVPIDIVKEGFTSFSLPVTFTDDAKGFQMQSHVEFRTKSNEDSSIFKTEEFSFDMPNQNYKTQYIVSKPRDERVIIYNGEYRYQLRLKAGALNDLTNYSGMSQSQVLGPPFGFDEFERLTYTWTSEIQGNQIMVTLRAKSLERTGLTLIKRMIFTLNNPIITIEIYIQNESDRSFSLTTRTNNRGSTRNPSSYNLIIPFYGEIIRSNGIFSPRTTGDFGEEAHAHHESWIAFDSNHQHNQVTGVIWKDGEVNAVRIGGNTRLDFDVSVGPNTNSATARYFLYCGPGDWRNVRDFWYRNFASHIEQELKFPHVKNIFEFALNDIKPVDEFNSFQVELVMESKLLLPYEGELIFNSPEGCSLKPAVLPFKCIRGDPQTLVLNLTLQNTDIQTVHIPIELKMQHGNMFDEIEIPVPQIDVSSTLQITKISTDEYNGFQIQHPEYTAIVYPNYSAGITSLKLNEVELLDSTFPKPGTTLFVPKAIGGFRATYVNEINDFFSGKEIARFKGILEQNDKTSTIFFSLDDA
ncbi:MAG: GNAT family N-acetyltransferase, partial [Candidatus Kariarchaeaceae archaeon]